MLSCLHLYRQSHMCRSVSVYSFYSSSVTVRCICLGLAVFGLRHPPSSLSLHRLSHETSPNSSHQACKKKRSWSRAVFSNLQRKGLEKRFELQKYVTKPDRRQLAAMLGLTDAQVSLRHDEYLMLEVCGKDYFRSHSLPFP